MTVVDWIVGLLVAAVIVVLLAKLILCALGKEDIRVKTDAPFELVSKDGNSMVIQKKLTYYNEGKQCATLMDAFVRPLLPYEQYDGIEARGKAEREGYPREDDYFEAVLIQKKGDRNHEDVLNVYAKVKLTARKGMSLDEALTKMVDLPLDVIWQETGRTPWHYRKVQLILPAEEIAKLAGVTLKLD